MFRIRFLNFFCICFLAALGIALSCKGHEADATLADTQLLEILEHERHFLSTYDTLETYTQSSATVEARSICKEYASFIQNNSKNVYAYILYGKFLKRIGEDDLALNVFLKANKLDDTISTVKQQIGNYLSEKGEYALALNYFLSAIKLDPEIAIYHYQLGELLYHFKESIVRDTLMLEADCDQQMLTAFAETVRLEPNNIQFMFRYGEAFYDVQNPDWIEARAVWNRLKQYPLSTLEYDSVRLHQARVAIYQKQFVEATQLLNTPCDELLEPSRHQLLNLLESK